MANLILGIGSRVRHPEYGVGVVINFKSDIYSSKFPNVDIRHGNNLTTTRWRKDQFRDQKYTKGWFESDSIPFWGEVSKLGIK